MIPLFLVFLFCPWRALAQGNWTTSPFNPPSMPLAVKSPYINAWAPLGFNTTGSGAINRAAPRLWDTAIETLRWYASIRVDGKPYNLLGDTSSPEVSVIDNAIQQSFLFTPTRSSYLLQAGTVNVNMTFMTPIEAKDLARQSMPFTYVYFDVEANDGNAHAVQIYSDITGEWIGGDNGLDANWTINESSNFVYLQMGLTSPGPYQELNNRPMDGTVYYCMKKANAVSWQIGAADDVRILFANGTGLSNAEEQGHHGIGIPYFDTLGIAVDIGSVSSTSEPVAYALGVVRDPVVQYVNKLAQIEQRSAYYWSNFSDVHDVIEDVLAHFDDALSGAISLDNQILDAAGKISDKYSEILSLSTRQAMGALEYTLLNNNGAFNVTDVKAFMKDMGNIGSGGVNAVDVLYASMPAYLYLNPDILGYLLSPLMEYQESTQYTNPYAAQDLGGAFPNATGNPSEHDQQIEHTASMLIMSLAHAQASGDGSLLLQHYSLLNGWASYLVNNTLNPDIQRTSISDGITSKNQTNLALKGIVAIGSMAKISEYTRHPDDQSHYEGIARQYVQEWTSLASESGLLAMNFGSGSSGLIYNLYADKLLQLNLFDSSVYDLQTSFYDQQTKLWTYGIPLDSVNTSSISRSDWMMFAASSVTNSSVRTSMISQVHAYASINGDNKPFPVSYKPGDGSWIAGENSPAQGAMFAPLALDVPIQSVTFSGGSSGGSNGGGSGGSNNIGAIVGATIGGVVGLATVVGMLVFFFRKRKRNPTGRYNREDRIDPVEPVVLYSPIVADSQPAMKYQDVYGSPQPSSGYTQPTSSGTVTTNEITDPTSITTAEARDRDLRLALAVENLQREVEQLRTERTGYAEAPPSYRDDLSQVGEIMPSR